MKNLQNYLRLALQFYGCLHQLILCHLKDLPQDLYNLNPRYGDIDQLKTLVMRLHKVGLKVLGDVVLNHRCAQYKNQNGVWTIFGGRLNWDDCTVVSDDPHFQGRGNKSSGDSFHAAPNIDHSQEFVRKDIKEWLQWLRHLNDLNIGDYLTRKENLQEWWDGGRQGLLLLLRIMTLVPLRATGGSLVEKKCKAAYILTHPGTPTVFYDHIFSDYQFEIASLISLRKRKKIHCRSTQSWTTSWQ